MKNILIIMGMVLFLACQKADLPQPVANGQAKALGGTYAISDVYLLNKKGDPFFKTVANVYKDGRIISTLDGDETFACTYDETGRQVMLHTGGFPFARIKLYTYAPNGRIIADLDSISGPVGGMVNSKATYSYHGAERRSEVRIHPGSKNAYLKSTIITETLDPRTQKQISISEHFKDNIRLDSTASVYYWIKTSPTRLIGYDAGMNMREEIVYSPSVKDPFYNLSSLPSFDRITDKPARDKSHGGPWLAGPKQQESMLMISHTWYNTAGAVTEQLTRVNIQVNDAQLPVYYDEVANGSPKMGVKLAYIKL